VPALEASGISKRYGTRDALRAVDLVVRPGDLHGLLGPNGAGKTTLMRVLLGLAMRDAGTVRIFGRSIEPYDRRVPAGVAGFVDAPAFYPYLSGRKNLSLLARLDGDGTSRAVNVDDVLDPVGLTRDADAAVRGYSAGMRQRLAIAAALMRSPQLLLLDEPTSSLDPAGARDVRALVHRLADAGVAVVLSSHDMSEVEELCTAVTVISHGQVIFSGAIEDIRQFAPAGVYVLRTSNDSTALRLAARHPDIEVTPDATGGLVVVAEVDALDAFVIALGGAAVAVRSLERQTRSLESVFLQITGAQAPAKIA
jgi:ABC-2 type transport system ATP-binding protein